MSKKTNTQILLDKRIEQEYSANQNQFKRIDDFFVFFASSQVMKGFDPRNCLLNKTSGGLIMVLLLLPPMLQL
jgi:hypothetical protein